MGIQSVKLEKDKKSSEKVEKVKVISGQDTFDGKKKKKEKKQSKGDCTEQHAVNEVFVDSKIGYSAKDKMLNGERKSEKVVDTNLEGQVGDLKKVEKKKKKKNKNGKNENEISTVEQSILMEDTLDAQGNSVVDKTEMKKKKRERKENPTDDLTAEQQDISTKDADGNVCLSMDQTVDNHVQNGKKGKKGESVEQAILVDDTLDAEGNNVVDKTEKKKKKKRKTKENPTDNLLASQQDVLTEDADAIVHLSMDQTLDNDVQNEKKGQKQKSVERAVLMEDNLDAEGNNVVGKTEKKKKKRKTEENPTDDLLAMEQDVSIKDVDANICSSMDQTLDNGVQNGKKGKKQKSVKHAILMEDTLDAESNNVVDKTEKKKKKRKTKENPTDDLLATEQDVSPKDADGNVWSSMDQTLDNDAPNGKKGTKRKSVETENAFNGPVTEKSNKKVRFSSHVEVFPLTNESNTTTGNAEGDNLVQGKRFTPEEDNIVKAAVYQYIADHNLGEEGLQMVLNSKKYGKKMKNCWREIGAAIPYRPYYAIYYRAQILFRRSEHRKWTQEEYEMVREYQKVHGNQWRALADELGKHTWHVKDAWRRIKLTDAKKGHWSQEEYQGLFELVNVDLQHRVFEEKRSKHGMLRDNIAWTAISDKLATRTQANCCVKWYKQLTSPMVAEGVWADIDDYRLIGMLYQLDSTCMEDVDWDNLLDDRSGDLCQKRWSQMVLHIGKHGNKTFAEQVEVLAQRYCPHLLETREAWDSKPRVP